MTSTKQFLRMTEAQISYVILTEMEIGLTWDDDDPALEYSPVAGGSERGRPSAEPAEVSQLRKALERFGNIACDVYCKHKAMPRAELIQKLGEALFTAIVANIGVEANAVGSGLGVACAIFFIKGGMDKSCAC